MINFLYTSFHEMNIQLVITNFFMKCNVLVDIAYTFCGDCNNT